MAKLQQAFNATQVDPTQSAGQLPLGRQPVVITGSEIKANKDNQGGHVAFELLIIDGPNKGQTGMHRLNLYHHDSRTAEIASRQFSAMCHVCGMLQVEDTAQLHNIPFVVDVTQQKLTTEQQAAQAAGQQVTPYTQVSKVFYIDGREPGKEGQGAAPAASAFPIPAGAPVQAPAPAAAPAGPPAGAWGGGAPAAPAPAGGGAAWGAGAPAPAAGGWQQGAAGAAPAGAAAKPAWGR